MGQPWLDRSTRADRPDPPGAAGAPSEEPTHAQPVAGPPIDRHGRPVVVRFFGSHAFFRLWLGQVVSSFGDWLGFLAIAVLAQRVGASSPETAIGVVVSARIVPGFLFSAVAGVVVDRWDRKKVMIVCDIARGFVLAFLPFIETVWGLVIASLLLEIPTLLWSPAKEASVPHLVPQDRLATANSLSLVAAYGTFPVATLSFAFLAQVADWLSRIDALGSLAADKETVAIYVDVVTFFVSAIIISTLALPRRPRVIERRINFGDTFTDLREGWRFIFINPVVRAVMVGLGTGLIGGGMLVPLGPVFSTKVLGAGPAGFGLLLTGLGFGVAGGIVALSFLQNRLPHERVFVWSVLIAGVSLLAGASQSSLAGAVVFVAVLGVCAGSVYILGFTILHSRVDDALRGRIFSTLYTLVRLCLLIAFALGPLLAGVLDGLSGRLLDHDVELFGAVVQLPGVRLTLWLAGAIIVGAGVLAALALRTRNGDTVAPT